MRRIVCNPRGLTAHMSVDEVARDQIIISEAARVAQCQRRILHRSADGPPYIDNTEPLLQEFFGFRAEMIAHPARCRVYRMVVVYLPRGHSQSLPRGIAHIVVE